MTTISRPVTTPLALHIDQILKPYRRGIPVFAALVMSLLLGLTVLVFEVRSSSRMLQGVGPHVSSLVESNDRPELQRLMTSIGDHEPGDLLVIKSGSILASSRSLSDLDQPYDLQKTFALTSQSALSMDGLLTVVPISRRDGPADLDAKLVMISPLSGLALWSTFVALLVLCVGLYTSSLFGERMRRAIAQAVQPVRELDTAIRSLRTLKDPECVKRSRIGELESIREAIMETHQSLTNARDALADAKAKELAAQAYRRLIHDLHNTVAALRTFTKIAESTEHDAETRKEAAIRIPQMAEQILSQMTAAKDNLDFEVTLLKEEDVRNCVQIAAEQAQFASLRHSEITVERQVPEVPVVVPHDPKLLGRAVSNLVRNAVDACQEKVRVVISQMNAETQILVMDDGPGIPPEKVGPYLQGRARSTKGDRQAYGLAAANHIVRSHGGRLIYRHSELGGACFVIRI